MFDGVIAECTHNYHKDMTGHGISCHKIQQVLFKVKGTVDDVPYNIHKPKL